MKLLQILTEAITLFTNLFGDLKGKHSLFALLMLAFAVSIASGLGLYLIDPNVHSLFDGIWSAWVTMTHVGFGDVVPTSFFGRLLSAAVILFGLALFSLFTATLSVNLIGKNLDSWGQNVRQIEQDTTAIESEESQILAELKKLNRRIDELEKLLSTQTNKNSL